MQTPNQTVPKASERARCSVSSGTSECPVATAALIDLWVIERSSPAKAGETIVLRMINRCRRRFFNGQRAGKDEIRGERDSETDKPGVVVKRAKQGNNQSNPGPEA